MKELVMTAAVLAAGLLTAKTSTPEGWTDDYDAALKRATEEKKYVVADFSGSDWCGWCMRLDEEVFATDVFRKGAKDRYVLLMIDSPRDKSKLSEKAKEQNPKLCGKYGIEGYPTVLILDGKGEVVARLGYQRGGPEKYLERLEREIKDAPDRKRYLDPIEKVLSRSDEAFEGELMKIQRAAMKKKPRPGKDATADERKSYGETIRAEIGRMIVAERVLEKYGPLFEKAFAEAEAMKVPERLAAKKNEMIQKAKRRFAFVKGMAEKALAPEKK